MALIISLVVAVASAALAVYFFLDLTTVSTCDGGFGFDGGCPGEGPSLAQLGHVEFRNGTYDATVILACDPTSNCFTNQLLISVQNSTGTSISLTSVEVDATSGTNLANYSMNGTVWTTTQSVLIDETGLIRIGSLTNLTGQELIVNLSSGGGESLLLD
jgi:hypothetical protein